MANTLQVRESGANAVRVILQGVHPLGDANFDVTLPATRNGDVLRLTRPANPARGVAIRVVLPLQLGTFAIANPSITVDANGDLLFLETTSAFHDALRRINIGERLQTLAWNPGVSDWSPSAFTIDMTARTLSFVPEGGRNREILIGDTFIDGLGDVVFSHLQFLGLHSVVARAAAVDITAQATDGLLLLHPDLLTAAEARAANNDLLYQYALVNGAMRISLTGNGAATKDISWVARPGFAEPPAMLAFRLSNEHGHPLLLESDGSPFALAHRDGVVMENIASPNPEPWEETNAAMLVSAPAGSRISLRSIDPLEVDLSPVDPSKRWLASNGMVARGGVPEEVHGLAKGTYLRRQAGGGNPAAASYISQDVVLNGRTVFVRAEVVLDAAAEWELAVQSEERDVYAGLSTAEATSRAVAHRVAAGAATPLRLPLIDTSWSLANLADPGGRMLDGAILNDAKSWLRALDEQFTTTAFAAPAASDVTHSSGYGVLPNPQLPLASVIDLPPGRADSPAGTARTPSELRTNRLHYVHGGERSDQTARQLVATLHDSAAGFGTPYQRFVTFWTASTLPAAADAARSALRAYMKEERRTNGLKREELEALLATAKEILYGGRFARVFSPADLVRLRNRIAQTMNVQAFETLWQTAADALVIHFLSIVWSGLSPMLYRRARAAVESRPAELLAHLAILDTNVPLFAPPTTQLPDGALPGFPTPAPSGLDPAVVFLRSAWERLAIDPLRRRYGAALTTDVYARIAENAADLDALWGALFEDAEFATALFTPALDVLHDELRALWDTSPALANLRAAHGALTQQVWSLLAAADRALVRNTAAQVLTAFFRAIRFDPPQYLFFTSRFDTAQPRADRDFARTLWNQTFHLARLSAEKFWKFLLGDDSTVIVKLTGERGIESILRDIESSYRTDARPNPLGLPVDFDEFIDRLDPAVRDPLWRGILVIGPTADISSDEELSTLAALSHIPMIYAAIGGAHPELDPNDIDIYANIFRERPPFDAAAGAEEDLTFTLIKFDATIRNTQLVAGEVIFRIDLQTLLGKTEGLEKPLFLRGTLPREKKDDTQRGGGSFEFAAWFETPIEYKLDFAFIDTFTFRALRVGTHSGQTSVDIDADIKLQKWNVDLGGLAFDIGPDGADHPLLSLQNFRILLPSLPKGVSIAMGTPRLLNFDLPSISFAWPSARPFNLWEGIELKPIGLGFIRRALGSLALDDLFGRYQWIGGPPSPQFQLPYLRCEINFGKLPSFGGTSLSRLNLELLIGLVIDRIGDLPSIAIGIGGLDARDISIDLFGILKLEIEKLILDRFTTKLDNKRAVTLFVDNPRLTILGWSPLSENEKLAVMLAHGERRTDGRAVLGWYSRFKPGEDEEESERFFTLHWLLLAHNLKFNSAVLTEYLLGTTDSGNAHEILGHLIDVDKKEIDGAILNDGSWLFGISFALGKIVERGTLVLHDQHYYGISLRGAPLEALFGLKRLELSYIPGPSRSEDRFRASFRLAALDLLGSLRSGDIAIEWGVNWDFLLDFGFPWRSGSAYLWQRAFSLPMGTYEAKFGLYFEKKTQLAPSGTKQLVLGAGAGFYLGYYFGFGTPGRFVWVQAGIGIFAILEGRVTFDLPPGGDPGLIKATMSEVFVRGVIGIYAYGEGGIEIWVISARFRVSVQAAIAGEIHYVRGGNCTLAYAATLHASYSASCGVGCGPFSFTFSVSGSVGIGVSGQALLN
jgi:hypothetical protein